MKTRNVIAFVLAVGISLVAATTRSGDSGHSIGLIKADGGRALHPTVMDAGKGRYMLISTATVIPPYRGDLRVALEGMPEIPYELSFTEPLIDLGIREFPRFTGGVITGLKPMDRIALWVKMTPPPVDPVCGMAHEERFTHHTYEDREYAFCSDSCLNAFIADPAKYKDMDSVRGQYELAFYDTETGSAALRVPLIFAGAGEEVPHGGGHH